MASKMNETHPTLQCRHWICQPGDLTAVTTTVGVPTCIFCERDSLAVQLANAIRERDLSGAAMRTALLRTETLELDRDSWKRRAIAHGCDAEKGDPDCG